MNHPDESTPLEKPVVSRGAQWFIFVAALVLVLGGELMRWFTPGNDPLSAEWLCGRDSDWLPFVPFLMLFPLAGIGLRSRRSTRGWVPAVVLNWLNTNADSKKYSKSTVVIAIGVFGFAMAMSYWVGLNFTDLPPAYHDEYSYLFQAETYLAGCWSYPSFEHDPVLFDQMHVLNEGQFASRYFPGVGAWIAPFLAFDDPVLGHEFAQGLSALFVFLIGRELSRNGVGLLAALLFALSPGLLLFSNLLLAHHPTLVGLLFFLWSFLRARRTGSRLSYLFAGVGLSFAMLCRPMTAAGFGLPFGVVFAKWWLLPSKEEGETTTLVSRTKTALALGSPIVCGFAIVMVSNFNITGNAFKTPYSVYTETYTPRHVYGFNNVIRGEQHLGPKVIDNYDRWAKNLTPALAMENEKQRTLNSFRWTLGIVPITVGLLAFLLSYKERNQWWLVFLAVVSLHVVHVPYWFEGIMGWHYVFETAPLLLLLFAQGTFALFSTWRATGQRALCYCWVLMVVVAVTVNLHTTPGITESRLDRGVNELLFPKKRYAFFRQSIEELRAEKDAIVFVIPDSADVSMDYVTNPPSLDGPVLVARIQDRSQLPEKRLLFPERMPIVFDAASMQFEVVQ